MAATRVVVVTPRKGGIERTSNQPGTIEPFDYAGLYSKVAGYLKNQPVDIGDKVSKDDVLAEIDAPELVQDLKHAEASLAQARAQVAQAEARVATAQADFEAAMANIAQVEAELGKAVSYRVFREKQYERVKNLFDLKSVDERLVDEKEEQRDAALAAEQAARAGILTARAQAAAAKARVAQAQADVADAQAKIQVAQSTVARAAVFVDAMQIVSPYAGIITRRNFHVGDFIRAAEQGAGLPLLTVARTDLMRAVVQVPERDVPFTNPGDEAVIEIDALPGRKFKRTVSRIAGAEDKASRTMRTEIDLENNESLFRDGMFLRVTISLHKATDKLIIPSAALIGDSKTKKTSVFVVREGKVRKQNVEVAQDDGVQVEVASGLSAEDLVVARPGSDLADGVAVEVDRAKP